MKNKRVKQMMLDTTKSRYPHSGCMWYEGKNLMVDGCGDYDFTFSIDLGQVSLTAQQLRETK